MNNQEYLVIFMYLYFVIIPLAFATLLISNLILERRKEYKKRKKLKEILSDENN